MRESALGGINDPHQVILNDEFLGELSWPVVAHVVVTDRVFRQTECAGEELANGLRLGVPPDAST